MNEIKSGPSVTLALVALLNLLWPDGGGAMIELD